MYEVEVVNKGSGILEIKSQGEERRMDLDGDGMHPPDVLLESLAECIGVYVRSYFRGMKQALSGFRIKAWGELEGGKGTSRFEKISVEVALNGVELDEMHMRALHRFVENCAVHNTLKSGPSVDIVIK